MTEWSRVRELFEEALDVEAGERTAYLDRACGGDTELRGRVERLLEADTAETDGPVGIEAEVPKGLLADREAQSALVGQRIGAYRVNALLGSGGMGTVFEAEQDRPRRKVALKVMRLELTSAESRRRFQYEAEVLGRLHHPSIAQVHEAGTWREPHGGLEIPYFAMELVEGARTLDRWVADEEPEQRRVLSMFVKVCDAVHHGHQVGVLHRDLKPGNVLVDGEGRPKIIDFGIARATDSGRTNLTLAGQVLGTLQYMSPEQVAGGEVDTRSDVYALGSMLYEVLAGRMPLDPGDDALHVYAQRLQREEPLPPSRHRAGVPADLDWIVLRAIAKEPGERYASVSELGADLERFLREEPVVARPHSQIYTLRKFVRRNRRMVTGAAVLLMVLAAATVVSTTGWIRASRAEREARLEARTQTAITDFTTDLIQAASETMQGEDIRVVDFLARADGYLEPLWNTRPEVAASVQVHVAHTYFTLGRSADSLAHAEAAVTRALEELGPDHPSTAAALHSHGMALLNMGRLEEAEVAMRRALEAREIHGTEVSIAYAHGALGQILEARGDYDAAEVEYREALGFFRGDVDRPRDWIRIETELASLLHTQGRLEEAEAAARPLLVEAGGLLQEDDPALISVRSLLATVLRAAGKPAEAETLTVRNLELARARYGPTSRHTLSQLNNLAALRQDQGKLAEAEQTMREIWQVREQQGDSPSQALISLNNLSILLERQDKLEEAEEHFQILLERAPGIVPEDHWLTGQFHKGYGVCLRKLKRFEEAEEHLLVGMEIMEAAIGREHFRTQVAIQAVVGLYEELEQEESAALYRARIVR